MGDTHRLNLPALFDDPHLVVFRDEGAGSLKLWPVLRYTTPCREFTCLQVHASRDGLLVFSNTISHASDRIFYVCNPTTRQFAPLPQLFEPGRQGFTTSISGLYLHQPSHEYRVLYFCRVLPANWIDSVAADFYVMTVGSDEPRRFIGQPPPSSPPSIGQALLKGLPCSNLSAPTFHHGSLHWDLGRYHRKYTDKHDIMVFDTTAETFRWMRRPAEAPLGLWPSLSEMKGALALFSGSDGVIMDVFVMQDYKEEVWVLRHRINLSAAVTALPQFDLTMGVVNEREFLIELPGRLLHCDIDGKVLGVVDEDGHRIHITTYSLKESIVPLALFQEQKGHGASDEPRPFFLGM